MSNNKDNEEFIIILKYFTSINNNYWPVSFRQSLIKLKKKFNSVPTLFIRRKARKEEATPSRNEKRQWKQSTRGNTLLIPEKSRKEAATPRRNEKKQSVEKGKGGQSSTVEVVEKSEKARRNIFRSFSSNILDFFLNFNFSINLIR